MMATERCAMLTPGGASVAVVILAVVVVTVLPPPVTTTLQASDSPAAANELPEPGGGGYMYLPSQDIDPDPGQGASIPETRGTGTDGGTTINATSNASGVWSPNTNTSSSEASSAAVAAAITPSVYVPGSLDVNPYYFNGNISSESYAAWESGAGSAGDVFGNATTGNGSEAGAGTGDGEGRDPPSLQPYSTAHLLTTSIILGTMILLTIIGNVFVIAAIILERNLHNVGNYLIVSLSVADLMVAALVMPLAAVNEISTQWFLGPEICDMWTSFDLICCTSSILHLVAIAMDRYWAVTRVDYIHNRSSRRILIMIALSWLVGVSISIPPLFGWQEESNDPATCMISQDRGYAIFATVGSFYVPLFLVLFIYLKVFRAAKSRIRKKNFKALDKGAPRPLLCANATGSHVETSTDGLHDVHDGMPLTQISSSNGQSPEHSSGMQSGHSNGSAVHLNSMGHEASGGGSGGRNNNKHLLSPQLNLAQSTETLTPPASPCMRDQGMKGSFLDITKVYFDLKKGGKGHSHGSGESPLKKREKEAKAARDRLEQKRERKAARTLAIITGSFVICWLPFFIIALVRPFCASCYFHPLLLGVIGWLGYFNSLLNPIIYTVFNPDFRSAFRKILFGKYRGQQRSSNWR